MVLTQEIAVCIDCFGMVAEEYSRIARKFIDKF